MSDDAGIGALIAAMQAGQQAAAQRQAARARAQQLIADEEESKLRLERMRLDMGNERLASKLRAREASYAQNILAVGERAIEEQPQVVGAALGEGPEGPPEGPPAALGLPLPVTMPAIPEAGLLEQTISPAMEAFRLRRQAAEEASGKRAEELGTYEEKEKIRARYAAAPKVEETPEQRTARIREDVRAREEAQVPFEAARERRRAATEAGKPPVPGKLTKEERQQFSAINYALPKLDAFAEYVQANPGKYGKWDAFAQGLRQQIPGMADTDYATKGAFIGRMNAEIRHALFGASLTDTEKESAKSFMIDATDQPPVILAKLQDARGRMQNDIDYYEGQGYRVGGGKRPPARATSGGGAQLSSAPSMADFLKKFGSR